MKKAKGSFPTFSEAEKHISDLVAIGDQTAGYLASAMLGVPPENLAYFAASLFWRTLAAKQKLPQDRIGLELLPEVVQGLQEFLLGKSLTIANVALDANLIGRLPEPAVDLRYVFSLPQEITRHQMGNEVRFYNTECLGFVFFLISAPEPILAYAQSNCILHNESHPIFIGQGIQQGSIRRQYSWVGGSTPTDSLRTWRPGYAQGVRNHRTKNRGSFLSDQIQSALEGSESLHGWPSWRQMRPHLRTGWPGL